MGWGGARKLLTVLDNVRRVLAIELLTAVRAIELRSPLHPAPGTGALVAAVRERVAPLTGDRPHTADIETVAAMIDDGEIAAGI